MGGSGYPMGGSGYLMDGSGEVFHCYIQWVLKALAIDTCMKEVLITSMVHFN